MSFTASNVNHINGLYSLYTIVCKMAKEKDQPHWTTLKAKLQRILDEECVSLIKYDDELLEGKRRFGIEAETVAEHNPFNMTVPQTQNDVQLSCEPDSTE